MEQQLFNPDIYHRRSIRQKGYDYARIEAYFVTICSQNRECLLGGIVDGIMESNGAGRMATDRICWSECSIGRIHCDAEPYTWDRGDHRFW